MTKQISINHKLPSSNVYASAGPDGANLAPPSCGLDASSHDLTPLEAERAPSSVATLQRKASGSAADLSAGTHPPNHTGLPDILKAGVESLSGLSLNDVHVHYNSSRPAQLQALAYTQGTDIHVGPGQERHLPHEAWHVVQQKQGRVRPTLQMKGTSINDEDRLEQEATAMGRKATTGKRFRLQPEITRPAVPSPKPVAQRQPIKSAGLELELKGAGLHKIEGGDAQEYGLHEKVIDNDDWWIEADSNNPELVTNPTEDIDELFSWLKQGSDTLKDIQEIAEKAQAFEDAKGAEKEKLGKDLELLIIVVNLPRDAEVNLESENKYVAKPQISFGIKKGQLSNFAQIIGGGNKIKYTEAYTNTGDEGKGAEWSRVNDTQWSRINDEVYQIYRDSPIWKGEKGQAFLKQLLAAPSAAQGLSLMTIITILFATRKQDPKDSQQYYKARFSVMPRVPLSDLFDALEEDQRKEYVTLMQAWLDLVRVNNQGLEETSKNYYPTRIETRNHKKSIGIEDEVESIIDAAKRRPKTLKGRRKAVDAISSDKLAGKGNVGASVGAFDLPDGSDGIYEIRSMPYIKIDDYEKVEKIYAETIAAYGGMA